jgi:hypothetical protein
MKKDNYQSFSTILVVIFVSLFVHAASSQTGEKKQLSHFQSVITLTTKGISTIPSFTLGKPALMFDLSMGKEKISFDPLFRFSLEGKPWTFIFWFRYNNIIDAEKFKLTVGAHPAIVFKTSSVIHNGVEKKSMISRRYLASELAPNWLISNRVSLGVYYLYSRCLESDAAKHTHYLALRTNFSEIRISDKFLMKFLPQIYYLKIDRTAGYYWNYTLTLLRRGFPISVSSIVNKTIKSDVSGSRDLIWNVNMVYTFSAKYTRQ